ncbi:hypothetical protein [Flavobacterium fluviatile]|uniref:hypothetical protein n=1 Tax=Flavobacterium fluviatile TaxID=1862387 RepID=UPI0013D3AE75|nr:hypothetical protein [Flavobacterium fluviatile]
MTTTDTYKGIDLTVATQADLAKSLKISPVLISPENEISEEEQRIFELFAFAESHQLDELTNELKAIYPSF